MGFQLVCVHQIHRLFQTNLLSCISQPVSSVSHSHSAMLEPSRENWLRTESSHEKWLRTESSRENWLRTKLLSKKNCRVREGGRSGFGETCSGTSKRKVFPGVLQFILRLNCNMLTPLLVSMVLTEVVCVSTLRLHFGAHANQTQTLSLGNS